MITPSAAINLVVSVAIAICLALIILALNMRHSEPVTKTFHPISYRDC